MEHAIHLIGLNHRTASVEVRERFALADFCTPENWAIPLTPAVRESLILSTCNRVEVIIIGDGAESFDQALHFWGKACCAPANDLQPYIYHHTEEEAVRHLFSVASSLDSMVLGEPQILGQLKTAYRKSVQSNHAGFIINRLLHKAFSVAKRVRTETAVASSAVSISYAAVELAKRIFDDIQKHTVLLIGACEMAELAAMHLAQAGVKEILVANRTRSNAEELALRVGGRSIPFEQLTASLVDADIVISSTGSPDPILNAKDMRKILHARKQSPIFLIDIAMPRDIDPDVNNLDNVYLYDIDDLKDVVEVNLAQRRDEADKAKLIVEDECRLFINWKATLTLTPTIAALGMRGQKIMEQELARTFRRLGKVDDATREALEIMAASVVSHFNHAPINFLRKNENHGKDNNHIENIDIIQQVFGLESYIKNNRS